MTRGGGGGVVTHTHSGRPSVLSATGGQGQRRRASPAPHSLPRSGHVCGGGLGGDKVWAAGAGGAGSCVRCSCRSPRHGAGGLEPRGAGLAGLLPGGSCCWGQHFSGDQGSGIRPLGDGLYSRFPRRPRGPRGSTGSGGGGRGRVQGAAVVPREERAGGGAQGCCSGHSGGLWAQGGPSLSGTRPECGSPRRGRGAGLGGCIWEVCSCGRVFCLWDSADPGGSAPGKSAGPDARASAQREEEAG